MSTDNCEIVAMVATKPAWQQPTLVAVPIEDTAGDPTISDDGLGDGLFS